MIQRKWHLHNIFLKQNGGAGDRRAILSQLSELFLEKRKQRRKEKDRPHVQQQSREEGCFHPTEEGFLFW
jgi:hypothetical protein